MVRIWRFISIAFIACNSSILFAFVSRIIVDLFVPVVSIRVLIILVMLWLLYDQKSNQGMYGAICCGLSVGWFLGYWDEFSILIKFHFIESFMLPLIVIFLISFFLVSSYVRSQAKS